RYSAPSAINKQNQNSKGWYKPRRNEEYEEWFGADLFRFSSCSSFLRSSNICTNAPWSDLEDGHFLNRQVTLRAIAQNSPVDDALPNPQPIASGAFRNGASSILHIRGIGATLHLRNEPYPKPFSVRRFRVAPA